ncbi:hypothetical protein RJ55_04746 [Drechmeria coniospora]|nr:hypothetical protein RJ55_04746 [Drechmeria coniospora]
MATVAPAQQLSDAILDFSLCSKFPEDIAELPPVSDTDLQPAIDGLSRTKHELESQLHRINEETRDDVSSWVKNAKTLQEDIIRSKTIANEIVRQSEAPDISGEAIQDAEATAEFLNREVQYTRQLSDILRRICTANQLLSKVEIARNERRILDSLRLLEQSWAALDEVGVSKTCRVMRILDLRSFELKSDVHDIVSNAWKVLVRVDVDAGKVTIYDAIDGENLNLSEAVVGLKAYKEVDERMEQLWRNLDAAIVSPRMTSSTTSMPAIKASADELQLDGQSDTSAISLLLDLERVFVFLARKLPSDLIKSLSDIMMAELVPKIVRRWLNPAVPSSLAGISKFQDMVQHANRFCAALEENGYSGFDELVTWAGKAHLTWLERCREDALDTVRTKLTAGIGKSKQVEKVERHMVSVAEGMELATTGAGAAADTNEWGEDWGESWDDEGNEQSTEEPPPPAAETATAGEAGGGPADEDGADAWGWGDDTTEKPAQASEPHDEEDAGAEAWGWDDDGATTEPPVPEPKPPKMTADKARKEQTRELILKETYNISSMPEPVLALVVAILEDGAALTRGEEEYSLVASTAPGLFSLPTFALALFRAISPHYYSLDAGGNMFLYNDAMYIAEKLSEFAASWKDREDLTRRARSMLRLDNDIKTLQSFANRSYGNEMNIQKTVLQDLLGGSQSLMQQDEMESSIESGTARIRTLAATWEPILARSVWSQAIGSLADALATRLITDILDMSSIGQEEAYRVAKLIASATELDDLFLPSKLGGTEATEDEVPATAQYAPNWLRLKYLSEVLQSNLNEVKFLWLESELSLYFTVDEVVELINASFEDNGRTRETIKEIQSKPQPMLGREA